MVFVVVVVAAIAVLMGGGGSGGGGGRVVERDWERERKARVARLCVYVWGWG